VISFKELEKMGRLGNMMFQMAATIALALRHNDKYIFPRSQVENYFSLYECFSNNITNTTAYIEPGFHYTEIPYRQNLDIRGFFQSERYFADYKDVIQALLTPRIGYGIKRNTTAIHVRRGDYTKLTREYAKLDMNYYKRAMDIIKSKQYLVFSDDITWCRQQFVGDNIEFSEGFLPIEDMAHMISCENHIICNSTFGWWGAYLAKNPSKIVVAPNQWFGPALSQHNTKDLIPTAWHKI